MPCLLSRISFLCATNSRPARAKDSNGGSWILYGIVWAIGIVWYFFWAGRSKAVGVDVGMTYGELPPE